MYPHSSKGVVNISTAFRWYGSSIPVSDRTREKTQMVKCLRNKRPVKEP